jgi:hypothetical protein
MQEIDHGNGIVNIQTVVKKMLQQRRYVIREKSQLKFCYEAYDDSELTIHDKNAESWDISDLLKASLWKQ